jgi:hypothetical protein
MKGGVFVGQTPYTAMFIITNELSRKYPSLAKRGEGRFYDDVLTTKIPPNLPFPKGGISDIFMLLFESKVHVRFISKYLILSFLPKAFGIGNLSERRRILDSSA